MIKRLIVMLVIVGIVFFLIFGFGAFRSFMIGKFLATLSNPTQTVATIVAQKTPWQPTLSSVGSVVAINGASLSSETSGIVDTIDFKSGDTVPAGTVLLTLRPNNDPALLAQLQATASLDAVTLRRDIGQLHADAVSQATVDTDRANLAAAQAQVASQQALIAEKTIKAPFAGTLGIRQVDLGEYLAAGTAVVTLQQLNPLFVDFYLPQQDLSQVAVGQQVTVSIDAFAGKSFSGTIAAINPLVDTTTRTVQVRAVIQNPDMLIKPGMFATVDINVGAAQQLVTLPQTAVTYNPYGSTVYLVHDVKNSAGKDMLTAEQTFVTTGQTRGDQVAVLNGVNPGDQVVTAGQMKLKTGSPVVINNSIEPSNNPNPNPPNE
jgi:membrane fusion protein (multidrug efflux system)